MDAPRARLHADQRQPAMRRIKQAGCTKELDPMSGIGQGKTRVAGASTHEGPARTRANA